MQISGIKRDIKQLGKEELIDFFVQNGDKKFRASQVYDWLWKKNVTSFDEMTNLSKATREFLEKHFYFRKVRVTHKHVSSDKTIKLGFTLQDGYVVEGVLIPAGKRMTACISSQVGCALDCKFCATGKLGFSRDLTAGEIVDQVVAIDSIAQEEYNCPLSNIVYMGMGEPLKNYENVMESIRLITSDDGLGMSPKRITLSTSGVADKIKQLADDNVKFHLAISLHSADNEKRSEFMPVNEAWDLVELSSALQYFVNKTGERPTFEYVMLKGVNDSISDAKKLAEFCRSFPSKINIIEYNPVDETGFKGSPSRAVQDFVTFLESKNMVVNVRRSRGKDIDAACGQLASED